MSVLIKHMAMPKGCIYANDKDQTDYCPMLNHDDVPFCQYIENEPEIAIGIDERPVYCPLSDVPDTNVGDMISRRAATDALKKAYWDKDIQSAKDDPCIVDAMTDWAIRQVKALPSAQPEIIRCKDCKNWMPYDWMFSEIWRSKDIDDYSEDEIGCAYCDMSMCANDFCSRAERRTDG